MICNGKLKSMASLPTPSLTPEEYLQRERAASFKSEYFNGQMFAMAGTSENHSLIATNHAAALKPQVRDRNCKVYVADMRVLVNPSGLYTYPDITVVCGKPQFVDGQFDTLMNPLIVVEILSPTTEACDRGPKLEMYRKLATLREYLLVAQDRVYVEHGVRQDAGWLVTESTS